MAGYVVHQADVPMRANAARTEHYRTTLGKAKAPIDTVVGGWYTLGPGATNPLDVHTVPEIYFVTEGSALITLDGETIWERKADGGFPEAKVLKQRVRDHVWPERDLGHSDR